MAKVMNVVFGIGVAILLYLVVLLGVQAFYSEPEYEDYCEEFGRAVPKTIEGEYVAQTQEELDEQKECRDEFNAANKEYGKILFFITAIAGSIIIVVSFFLLNMVSISAGVALSGLALIVYGFARGWNSTGEIPKFIMALVVATVVIYFAVKIHKKLEK